jgi:hypothetical protein
MCSLADEKGYPSGGRVFESERTDSRPTGKSSSDFFLKDAKERFGLIGVHLLKLLVFPNSLIPFDVALSQRLERQSGAGVQIDPIFGETAYVRTDAQGRVVNHHGADPPNTAPISVKKVEKLFERLT